MHNERNQAPSISATSNPPPLPLALHLKLATRISLFRLRIFNLFLDTKRNPKVEGNCHPQTQPFTSGLAAHSTVNCQKNTELEFEGSSSDSDSCASDALADDLPELSLQLPVGGEAPDKEDALCMFCEGVFPDDYRGELWVRCEMCDQWAHSECAGAERGSSYMCNFCR
ncbi:hypothetical protein PR048_007846 [Dryococelus australis]|uniref:Zinc finger PHD-type domain-containing protein n=1 Tax=Dryococelus australis TaxID=614101 RepID=A0ABQ9HVF6_9NEOP|nr:hypothetical protein PR048_007846 [Dryococelus australis]